MNSTKKIAFHTLGCKLNFAETATISRKCERAGMEIVDFREPADYYVINTCTVTNKADKDFTYSLRSALRTNPQAKVIAIGCYAQVAAQQISQMEGVSLVLGNKEKYDLVAYLMTMDISSHGPAPCFANEPTGFSSSYSTGERTRSFLKIQDGCDYHCSYCAIPAARGGSRSDKPAKILSGVDKIAARGMKEIVLTGVNIGDYGKKLEEYYSFLDLIKILDKTHSGIERFRISSIEPNLLSDAIIDFVASSSKFMPHFHIPLQSGSDTILGLMRRRYKRELYAERVWRIKEKMPDACIGSDVIVGFPGETDDLFEQTRSFLESLPISYLHVFTYSERRDTPAATMNGSVPMHIRHERNKILTDLSAHKKAAFYRSQWGKTRPVLFESTRKGGAMFGFTDNYVRITAPYDADWVNTIEHIEINENNTIL